MAVGDIVPVPGAQFEETLASASPDVLREMIREFAQRMMDADVEVRCNAGYGEVMPDRVNSRNGYRQRDWDTRAGTIELAIPKLRAGSYFPWFLEHRRRAERALASVAITPDGRTAYVLSQRGVIPISTATNKPGKPINAGKDLTGIAITPDGRTAYVVSTFSATVTPIRIATNTALKAIKIGKPPTGYEFPDQIAITPNSVTAYVSTTAGVVPIRTATNTALKLIKVGNGQPAQPGPSAIAITPDGKTAYVVNLIAGTVTPISTATNTPGRPVVVKSSRGVMLDGIGIAPDGRTAYILNEIFEPASFPGTVIPLRTATNTLGKPITVGTAPSAIVFAR